jgi:hypothetical protein
LGFAVWAWLAASKVGSWSMRTTLLELEATRCRSAGGAEEEVGVEDCWEPVPSESSGTRELGACWEPDWDMGWMASTMWKGWMELLEAYFNWNTCWADECSARGRRDDVSWATASVLVS